MSQVGESPVVCHSVHQSVESPVFLGHQLLLPSPPPVLSPSPPVLSPPPPPQVRHHLTDVPLNLGGHVFFVEDAIFFSLLVVPIII